MGALLSVKLLNIPEDVEKPLVSILTPTWYRAEYLERVWSALCDQTCHAFEWIVADDGSVDATDEVVQALAVKSSFPVTFVSASVHIGKARADNEAIACARNHFVLWNDSDDYLLPEAIERLLGCWNSISEADRAAYVGIIALCANGYGALIGNWNGAYTRNAPE